MHLGMHAHRWMDASGRACDFPPDCLIKTLPREVMGANNVSKGLLYFKGLLGCMNVERRCLLTHTSLLGVLHKINFLAWCQAITHTPQLTRMHMCAARLDLQMCTMAYKSKDHRQQWGQQLVVWLGAT